MRFAAVGLGIAELASEAIRVGAESTLVDDPTREGLAGLVGQPGALRFAAYDGAVACGLVAVYPNGTGQADATVVRFDARADFPSALRAFLSKTMDFAGLELVRAYARAELGWLTAAGFSHDGRMRRVWRPAGADPSTQLLDIQVYSITLDEARQAAEPLPPSQDGNSAPDRAPLPQAEPETLNGSDESAATEVAPDGVSH